MSTKATWIVVGVVALALAVAGVFVFGGSPEQAAGGPGPSTLPEASQPASSPVNAATFTMSDVATHADAASCYTAINGSVYDLTAFVNRHPGGAGKILSICGKDGTAAFQGKHGGMALQESTLAGMKIGTLQQAGQKD